MNDIQHSRYLWELYIEPAPAAPEHPQLLTGAAELTRAADERKTVIGRSAFIRLEKANSCNSKAGQAPQKSLAGRGGDTEHFVGFNQPCTQCGTMQVASPYSFQ